MKVMVLGGGGFIGRHATQALLGQGHEVVVGTRKLWRRARTANYAVTLSQVRLHHLLDFRDWIPLLKGIHAVVNCVGILRQRPGESYERIHRQAPAALARACRALNVRLVHVSALGLSATARSRFCRSKHQGEVAILREIEAGLDATIVRPSLLDGDDGFGARWLRRVARWPVMFAPAQPNGRIAPFHVDDLGAALAVLATQPGANRSVVELGGPAISDIGAYLRALRAAAGLSPTIVVRVPAWLVRFAGHACDVLHFSPLSFGHVELMRRDNVPESCALSQLLGRVPRAIGERAEGLRTPVTEINIDPSYAARAKL